MTSTGIWSSSVAIFIFCLSNIASSHPTSPPCEVPFLDSSRRKSEASELKTSSGLCLCFQRETEGKGIKAVTTHWIQRRSLVKFLSHSTFVKAESLSHFTDGKTALHLRPWTEISPGKVVPKLACAFWIFANFKLSSCNSNRSHVSNTQTSWWWRQPRSPKQMMQLTHCKNNRGFGGYLQSGWGKILSLLAFFSPEPDLAFVEDIISPLRWVVYSLNTRRLGGKIPAEQANLLSSISPAPTSWYSLCWGSLLLSG